MTGRCETRRLELVPMSAEILDAMIDGDLDRLVELTRARFPGGIAPPLMDDALPLFLDRIRGGDSPEWWGWLAVDRTAGTGVGAVGFAGAPDADGHVLIGYSVYPMYEGRGYATEAARALLEWALAQPGVTAVRATVPIGHTASMRVAEKIGMRIVGETTDPEAGRVHVFERARP